LKVSLLLEISFPATNGGGWVFKDLFVPSFPHHPKGNKASFEEKTCEGGFFFGMDYPLVNWDWTVPENVDDVPTSSSKVTYEEKMIHIF
jgi:hypothetical protein